MTDIWRRVSVPAARIDGWLERFVQQHGPISVCRTDWAVELRAADDQRATLTAPFEPPPDPNADPCPDDGAGPGDSAATGDSAPDDLDGDPLDWLRRHLAARRVIAVLLLRRGGYAVGIFDGPRLEASKVGSSYVQGTTKAGGWSQQRYARRRDNQTRGVVQKAVDEASRVLGEHTGPFDVAMVGGDRPLIRTALEDPRLRLFASLVRDPFLTVGDPRLATLKELPDQLTAVRIALLP